VIVDADNLAVWYGRRRAIDGVSLRIDAGERILLTGRSGCGKSTLLRCLNGLIPHAIAGRLEGSLLVAGETPATAGIQRMASLVGMVFQNPGAQFFNLTVEEEVAAGPRNLGVEEVEVRRAVLWATSRLGLEGVRGRSIRTLSGGERQRLAIAAVLAMRPRLLVLDEPTSHLDVHGTRLLLETLASLNQDDGITVLVVEHRLGEVAHFTGRTIVMDAGGVAADGPTEDVFERRDWLMSLGLRRPAVTALQDWQELIVPNGSHPGKPVLEVRDVGVRLGTRPVLQDLSMELYEGEFAALVGDNGAGKSTLARVSAGMVKPRRGEVTWRQGRPRPGRDVALLFQEPGSQLFCDVVEDEVRLGPENCGDHSGEAVASALEATMLQDLRGRNVHRLSLGEQQRTALAALLAMRPRVLILDEPTVGQDWGHLERFMDFLVALNRTGTTVLLISHDFKLVHRYADRVLLLRGGRIVAEGTPAHRAGHGRHGREWNVDGLHAS